MSEDKDPSQENYTGSIVRRPMTPKQKFRIKLLFAAVILWQLPQSIIIARFGEPYPALVMPGFAGTMVDRDGNIRFGNVKCKVLFKDGRVGWVSAYDLLSQAPSSHHGSIMAHMFSPPPVTNDEWQPDSLKARLFPGRALSQIRHAQKELDSQTKEWLKRRLRVLFPSQQPYLVSFVWYNDVFNVNQRSPAAKEEPTGVREVRFE